MQGKRNISKKQIVEIVALSVAILLAALALLLTVSDPIILPEGDDPVTVDVFTPYEDAGAKARFVFFDITEFLETDNPVDTTKTGDYDVTYRVSFLFGSAEAVRTVKVVDRVAPVVTLKGDAEIRLESIAQFEDPGASATDNYDGDLTAKILPSRTEKVFTEGERKGETEYVYTYSVLDAAGNSGFALRTVIVKDVTPPVITLKGGDSVSVVKGQPYQEPGATAQDNVDGEIAVSVSGAVNTSSEGTYTVTYTAEDAAGNKSEATRKVTVRAPLPSPAAGEPLTPGGSYVALTFDDGPSGNTTAVLDVLKQYNIKATFFILNYPESYIPVLKRMISEGHTLAIHSYSHEYSSIYTSPDAYMQGLYTMHDKILRDTGYNATIIRFPGGSSNTVSRNYCQGVMTALTKRVEAEGYSYYDWNVDSGDADGSCMAKDYLVKNVKNGLRSGRVNVVLMHDASSKSTTPQALPEIIADAQARGFSFVPLSSSVPPVHHGINN